MCDPTALAIGSFVVGAAGSISGHASKDADAKANREAAERAAKETMKDLSLQEVQERQAAATSVFDYTRQADENESAAEVAAGESGVGGSSVRAVLSAIRRQGLEARSRTNQNLDARIAQIKREREATIALRQSRVNSVRGGSLIGTGLAIGGAGLNAGSLYLQNKDI